MPQVRWLKATGHVVPADSSVRVGSSLRVQGRHYETGSLPQSFTIYRGYGRLATRYLVFRHKPTWREVVVLDAAPGTDTSALSEAFVVKGFGRRLRVPLVAVDDQGVPSQAIYSSRLGTLNLGPNVQVLGTGGGVGSAEIETTIDPDVVVSVLLPWATSEEDRLQTFLEEVALDLSEALDEDPATTRKSLFELVNWALPNEPPAGWQIEIPEPRTWVAENERGQVDVRFVAPTPGVTAFALAARTLENPGRHEFALSEVFVLETTSEDETTVELL